MLKFIEFNQQKEEVGESIKLESPIRQFVPDLGRSPINKAFPEDIIQKTMYFTKMKKRFV